MAGPNWDGSLTGEEFKLSALYLVEMWKKYCVDSEIWCWHECPKSPFAASDAAGGFLVLEDVPTSMEGTYYFFTYHIIYGESYRVPRLYFQGRYFDGRPLGWKDIQQRLPVEYSVIPENMKWTFVTQEDHPYLHRPWFTLHPCGTSSMMALVMSPKHFGQKDKQAQNAVGQSKEETDCIIGTLSHENEMSPSLICDPYAFSTSMQQYLLTWLSFASQAVGLNLPSSFSQCFVQHRIVMMNIE